MALTIFPNLHQDIAKNFCNQFITASPEKRYVFGINNYGERIADKLDIAAYVDDFTPEKEHLGKPIIKTSDVPHDGLVISTGGGMMLNAHNVAALSSNVYVFCLVATPEEIFKRISSDRKNNRPLLDTPNPLERISQLIKEREQSYRQFTQINTSGKNPQEITQDLLAIFHSHPGN